MSEVIITVRGESYAHTTPELAVAGVSVVVEGRVRTEVIERANALCAPVRDELAERQAAGVVLEWSSRQVSVWTDRPWSNDGKMLDPVHHATLELSATFIDFAALSDWLGVIAEREGLQVGSVEWRLTPATRAHTEREVATAAVDVAVARATAYASAIGLTSVTPLEIADVGLLSDGDRPEAQRMLVKASMAMDAGGSPAIGLQPETIVVSAAVDARFRAA
jgi:uncharacterized protein YggE